EGAFTGSKKGGKPGLFELAHGGSLFLDEIDSTPIMVQKRLLRVLQEREVMRLGGGGKIPVDVRIIVASGAELWPLVERKRFRKDLFFRLNILQIRVPPLRDRPSDIPLLLDYFSGYYQREHTIDRVPLTPDQLEKILNYQWPGNIRQFKAFVERLVLQQLFGNSGGDSFTDTLIEELYKIRDGVGPRGGGDDENAEPPRGSLALPPEAQEVLRALEKSQYNRGRAAARLGISRATLWRRMKKYDIGV
ncbi:MAG: sigma 54-interacting transcriptional regulator, partial [Desulfovibrionales bacterium]|nr:sigma 54-interacting transcriptional regulator [Desulfovibrionales bacterium]